MTNVNLLLVCSLVDQILYNHCIAWQRGLRPTRTVTSRVELLN